MSADESPNVPSEASRVAAYTEAIWGAQPEEWRDRTLPEDFADQARAVMAVADAECNTAYARGYQAAREHWKARAESADAEVERLTQVVARRKAHAEQAESERDAALVALASQDTYIEEGGLIVVGQLREQRARADAAERARDAALAEATELRMRIATCSGSCTALALPVTGDTEDGGMVAARHVTAGEIADQRDRGWPDFHPEDFCHRCGNPNLSWWVASNVWDDVMRPEGPDSKWRWNEIICPQCFVELAGGGGSWRLVPDAGTRWTGDTEDASPGEAKCPTCGGARDERRPAEGQALCPESFHFRTLAAPGAASPTEQATEGGAK